MVRRQMEMKKILFFIRNYKFDLLTTFFAVVSYFVSFKYSGDSKTTLLLSLVITLFSVSLIVYLRLRDKDFYFIALTRQQDKDDWIGRGTFDYRRTNDSFLITESEPGYIFSKTLNWSDYKYEFDFKLSNKCLGAIVRAANLSDYSMFQIWSSGIRPHIRINGGWAHWEAEESGLKFDKNLSLDKWYKCRITCEKDMIEIQILDEYISIFQRSWSIPHERFGFPFPQKDDDSDKAGKTTIIHFPVNLDYGTVGFRNDGDEKALVKNILIEKI